MTDRPDPVSGLAALLVDHPFPDEAALLHGTAISLSAGDARHQARRTADDLGRLGVGAGDAVVVQLPNGPGYVTAMTGVWLAGAVMVPASPRQPPAELDRVVASTGAVAIADDGGVRPIAPSGGGARRVTFGDDVAFVTWTSGTTGEPRPILHTHSGYLELLDRVLGPLRRANAATSQTPSPNLIPVSLALNAGIYNVLFGLRAGAALVLMERFTTADFADLVGRFEIRSTVLPPAAIVMLADDDEVVDLAPLRYVRSITAPLSPLAARRFADKFGIAVLNGYGQAEVGEVIGWTAADARDHPDKLGAVGRPHPGVAIKVVADDGTVVTTDGVGELLVRPPRMAVGYADGDELADRIDAEGFVRTGDYARVDSDGFVWIEGRIGDVINRGGNKVFPDQVEEVLRLSPRVRDAAVAGRADDRLGEVPVAFVVGSPEPGELEALCRRHLTPYKIPVEFVSVGELPRSEVGKVLRRSLLDGAGCVPPSAAASGRPGVS